MSALHARLGALRHGLAERKARSGAGGVAGAGAAPAEVADVELEAEEASAFAELLREAAVLLGPQEPRVPYADGEGAPAPQASGAAVGLLERLFDEEHGALDTHAQTADWLHALLAPRPPAADERQPGPGAEGA